MLLPAVDEEPALQSVHAELPASGAKLPAGQLVHEALPEAGELPAGQGVQVPAQAAAKLPAEQAAQLAWPSEAAPGAQAWQLHARGWFPAAQLLGHGVVVGAGVVVVAGLVVGCGVVLGGGGGGPPACPGKVLDCVVVILSTIILYDNLPSCWGRTASSVDQRVAWRTHKAGPLLCELVTKLAIKPLWTPLQGPWHKLSRRRAQGSTCAGKHVLKCWTLCASCAPSGAMALLRRLQRPLRVLWHRAAQRSQRLARAVRWQTLYRRRALLVSEHS